VNIWFDPVPKPRTSLVLPKRWIGERNSIGLEVVHLVPQHVEGKKLLPQARHIRKASASLDYGSNAC
jgi:hypothetical protein